MTIPRKKYTIKVKFRAVKLVLDDGLSHKEVIKKIGCAGSTLRKWIIQHEEERQERKTKPASETAEQIEIRKLREIIELNKLDVVSKDVMKSYNFQLVLSGVNIDTPNLEDSLFEAGCDDGLLCSYGQTVYITFTRESPFYESALFSAITDIENSSLNVEVIYVDYDGYAESVHLSDITALSSITHQIMQYSKDVVRGNNSFPLSIERVKEKHQVKRWEDDSSTVAVQVKKEVKLEDKKVITDIFNEALKIRNSNPRVKKLLSKLCDSSL